MGWGQQCRIRHVTSGRYLSVTPDNQVVTVHRNHADEKSSIFCIMQSKVYGGLEVGVYVAQVVYFCFTHFHLDHLLFHLTEISSVSKSALICLFFPAESVMLVCSKSLCK